MSHNALWKRVQQNFYATKDSFAQQTFENALAELVEENMVKRNPDPTSKLGKIWYSPILNFREIETDITRHFKTLVMFYVGEFKKFSKRYGKLSVYNRALELSRFFNLVFFVETMCVKYQLIFGKNKDMKSLERKISKLKSRLNSLSSNKNKFFTPEVNQLLIKNFESYSQEILNQMYKK